MKLMKNKKFINLFQNIEVSKELDNKILNTNKKQKFVNEERW